MALIACLECHKEISDKAAACPHCGAPVSANSPAAVKKKSSGLLKWVLGVPVGLFVVVIVFGSLKANTPEGQAKARARDAIDLCWSEQKRKSLAPGESQFVAAACERMESDFLSKYGVRP